MKLLEVKELSIAFGKPEGNHLTAVDAISFSVDKGERLGIVGESGAGKSITGFSILNLLAKPGFIAGGNIFFKGRDLTKLSEDEMRTIRGNEISMIFQDPMVTLNPVLTIGEQIIEVICAHKDVSYDVARTMAIDALRKVYIPSPEQRLQQYPHEFSGGMRQRIIIAIALVTSPQLIIADEPTTALDVTIQAEIMQLLLHLCEVEKMSLILVTHDLGVVSQVTQQIAVMYAGTIVEMGATESIVLNPSHPYTKGLLNSLPEKADEKTGRLYQISGTMPSLAEIPKGCPFYARCDVREDICKKKRPLLEKYNDVLMACFVR